MSCPRSVVRAACGAAVLSVFCLSACGGMQSRPTAPVQRLTPSPVQDLGPAPGARQDPTASGDAKSFAADATEEHAPPTEQKSAVVSSCTCTTAEPKHRTKRKPRRRKQAPSPAPPPAVAASPSGVVDAEVRATSVPVMSILGKRVQSPTGEDMGRVVDVLADDSGHVHVAIIDFGGFLGVGNRRIAVDWPLLRFEPGHDSSVRLSLSMKELRAAPEYKDDARPQILTEPPISAPAAASSAAPPAAPPASKK